MRPAFAGVSPSHHVCGIIYPAEARPVHLRAKCRMEKLSAVVAASRVLWHSVREEQAVRSTAWTDVAALVKLWFEAL